MSANWELILIYFAPSIFALMGRKRNAPMIIMIDVFFGWTIIGWLVAMAWSLTRDPGREFKL